MKGTRQRGEIYVYPEYLYTSQEVITRNLLKTTIVFYVNIKFMR